MQQFGGRAQCTAEDELGVGQRCQVARWDVGKGGHSEVKHTLRSNSDRICSQRPEPTVDLRSKGMDAWL